MSAVIDPPPVGSPPPSAAVRVTAADVIASLGVPAERVLVVPAPGTATAADCERCERPTELIDGTLVEKPVNNFSSAIAAELIIAIGIFAKSAGLRVRISGGDGGFEMSGRNVRLPDVGVTRAESLTGDRTKALPDWVPDLAVEVLSPTNTAREMENKRDDYFAAGVTLVWEIDPQTRTANVFSAASPTAQQTTTLGGGDVLPGFTADVGELIDAVP